MELCEGRSRLDMRSCSLAPPTAAATGEAGNDDVEDGHNAVDDGLEDRADSVDDGHEASADGLEDSLDL